MYGIVGVGAHGAIPDQQLVDLLGHRAVHRIWVGRAAFRWTVTSSPSTRASLDPCPAGAAPASSSRLLSRLNSSVSETRVSAELQFPLAPLLFLRVAESESPRNQRIGRPGDHVVVAELGQRGAVERRTAPGFRVGW